MALFDQLFFASFNGIPFYVDSSQTTYGRKTIAHEYPNKKYVYIEDMGENLRTFNVTGIVSGDAYLLNREALILALQRKGIGILTHPFYGVVYVVVISYTINEDIRNLGECTFNIVFREARQNIFPISGEESIAHIEGLSNEIAPYLEAAFITKFTTVFKKNIADASNKCVNLNTKLQPSSLVTTDQETRSAFQQASSKYITNRYTSIEAPATLQSTTVNLLNSYNDLGVTSQDSYNLNANVFGFGSDDIYIPPTTAERNERIQNRLSFNSLVNAQLLLNMYQNATEITFLNELQLSTVVNDLETKYQYLTNNNNLDTNTLSQLESLRTACRKFFDNVRVNVNKINNVTINPLPLTVLMYNFEQSFDDEDEIISLNNIYDVYDINGTVKILTS